MIIKLNAIDSTNAFLKRLNQEKNLNDYTVVTADKQSEGRGQRGAIWQSEPYKNLIMSVFKRSLQLNGNAQFYLSMAISMAVVRTLENFNIPAIKIKWPNDILSANEKICGILIESYLKSGIIDTAIIGIGLNVNQCNFPGLPKATSLKKQMNRDFDLVEIRNVLLAKIKDYVKMLENEVLRNKLKQEYLSYLFRINKPSTFENTQGAVFMGFITGVAGNGKLIVRMEDNLLEEFAAKEIKLLY